MGAIEKKLDANEIKRLLKIDKLSEGELEYLGYIIKTVGANPALGEIVPVRYGNSVQFLLSKNFYVRRALEQGFKIVSGVIYRTPDGVIEKGIGSFYTGELLGGWARLWKESWSDGIETTVALKEYWRENAIWKTMPATMIEKVAIVKCIRLAIGHFGYTVEEMPEDVGVKTEATEVSIEDL